MTREDGGRRRRGRLGLLAVTEPVEGGDEHAPGEGPRRRGDRRIAPPPRAPASPHPSRSVADSRGRLVYPFPHRHRRSLARLGLDVELVHEPASSWEAQTETSARREPVLHGERDVGDARALVGRDDRQAPVVAVVKDRDDDLAPDGVLDDVAGDLRDGRGDDRQVAAGEPCFGGELPAPLASRQDVGLGADPSAVVVGKPGAAGPLTDGLKEAGAPRSTSRSPTTRRTS